MLWLFFKALAFGLGAVWCYAIFKRLRADIADLKASRSGAERGAILVFWGLTALILLWMASFLLDLFGGLF